MSVRLIKAMLEAESRGETRVALAARLGVAPEMLDSLVQEYEQANGEGSWERLIIERRAQLDTIGANWDELEAVALQRLVEHTNAGRINTVGELLAVAQAANRAARKGGFSPRPAQSQGSTQFGITLPAGSELGVVELRLSQKVARQIESPPKTADIIEVPFERLSSPVELRALADADDKDES